MLWDISGDLGSGKTIKTVYLAYLSRKHYPKTPIFSNFKLHFTDCYLVNPEDLINMKYKNAFIILDEAYAWLESRISSSKLNRYMSYILFQSRKRGLDFVLTAQLPITIDIRFRQLCETEIYAEAKDNGFDYTYLTRRHRAIKRLMPYAFAEEKLFNKYDTLEIIEPFSIEEISQQVSMLSNPKKANEFIDIIVSEIKDLALVTHATVSDYLLRKELSQSLEPYVYARLKLKQRSNKKSNN